MEEIISINECIQITRNLNSELEQRDFVTEQEIKFVYLIQTKFNTEKSKNMKQATLQQWFKKIVKKTTEE